MRKHLILGMSHTNSIQMYLSDHPDPDFRVIDLLSNDIGAFVERRKFIPDVVCLSLRGNQHNVAALCEHPVKFTIGSLPLEDNDARVMVPYRMFEDYFQRRLGPLEQEARELVAHFPDVDVRVICPPPPKAKPENLDTLGPLAKAAKYGICPVPLRTCVYDMQCAIYTELADRLGAMYLPAPPQALTPEGLLAEAYSISDPTHANRDYGGLVIQQIKDCERLAA